LGGASCLGSDSGAAMALMAAGDEHSRAICQQVLSIEPGAMPSGARVFPCSVELFDGKTVDCVYVLSSADFRRLGLDEVSGGGDTRWIKPEAVRSVKESPSRLPANFARELSRAGESGMGYWAFTVTFSWWRRREYVQPFIDFIEYPRGLGPADVRSVKPHQGKRDLSSVSSLDVRWCAFDFPMEVASPSNSVTELTIPAGTPVYLGAPASPMAASLVQSLADIVAPIPAVVEAHVPQCWAPSAMNAASQILVVVLDQERPAASESERHIREAVASVCAYGQHLDIWFVRPDHFFLDAIRRAGCRIK